MQNMLGNDMLGADNDINRDCFVGEDAWMGEVFC